MTTVSTPHSENQSTSRCKSVVKVPKLRTGSGVRSAFTAAMCMVAPTSIAAAFGWTTAICGGPCLSIYSVSSPILQLRGKGWAALLINFLNGIAGRPHHSHVRNNPWTMFFCGVHATKKPSAAPFHQEDTPQPFLRPQADAVRDGFFERDLVPLEEPPDRR